MYYIGPNSLSDYARILAAVQERIKQGIRLNPVLGILQFRAGQYAAAVNTLTPVLTPDSEVMDAWLYLAMAHWHLGHKDEARRCLKIGEDAIAAKAVPDWYLKKRYALELQEAHTLISPR